MGDFKQLFTGFMIIGLFLFSMFAFITVFQSENNASNPIMNNQIMSTTYGNLSDDLINSKGLANSSKALFESENPKIGFGEILLFSILSAGKVFNGIIIGVYATIIELPAKVLGVPEAVIAVLSTLLLVGIVLGLWRVYKVGD